MPCLRWRPRRSYGSAALRRLAGGGGRGAQVGFERAGSGSWDELLMHAMASLPAVIPSLPSWLIERMPYCSVTKRGTAASRVALFPHTLVDPPAWLRAARPRPCGFRTADRTAPALSMAPRQAQPRLPSLLECALSCVLDGRSVGLTRGRDQQFRTGLNDSLSANAQLYDREA